jgi:hypothetical protein
MPIQSSERARCLQVEDDVVPESPPTPATPPRGTEGSLKGHRKVSPKRVPLTSLKTCQVVAGGLD